MLAKLRSSQRYGEFVDTIVAGAAGYPPILPNDVLSSSFYFFPFPFPNHLTPRSDDFNLGRQSVTRR